MLTEHYSDWKKTAEARKNMSKNLACWNCESLNHRARKCPKPLHFDMRKRLEERHQFKGGYDYGRSFAPFEKRNFHSGARAEELEIGKRTKERDSDDHYSFYAATRPAWFAPASPPSRIGDIRQVKRRHGGTSHVFEEVCGSTVEEEEF